MPTFGVSIYSISRKITKGEISPTEGVKWLAENGAQAVEIVPFGIDLINEPTLINLLKKAAREGGSFITNYSLNANFLQITNEEYETEMLRVQSHINAAASLGVSTIRVDCSSFRRPIETNTTEEFQRELPIIIETYEKLCDYANQHSMTVLLENHGFHVNGAERVRQIITSLNRKNFGFQLDTGNFECVDDRAEIATSRLLPFAKTIHVKDFYIREKDPGDATQFDCSGSWFRSVGGKYLRGAILGQGDLDMYKILGDIKRAGFEGTIFVEFEGMEDCLYGTKVSLDNLKRIYEEV
ncbi:MAG: sugar phosphate isomerase/epimerase [Defluviitaleaceae bacterium]|nr:sugar phosphate isomerase/epimerase [Defluviitaleaceae bacterium]MCL2273929.1 sugar phosphate isomerase/epimerase [Defluviitaleaceae bacterium]